MQSAPNWPVEFEDDIENEENSKKEYLEENADVVFFDSKCCQRH